MEKGKYENESLEEIVDESSSRPSQVGAMIGHVGQTLAMMLETTREQIALDAFQASRQEEAEAIARIIAEVKILPDGAMIQIGGEKKPAWIVRQVYDLLDHEHALTVVEAFRKLPYRISHVKTYLRTALYNAVFELPARTINDVRSDMPWMFRD